jgi:hypothetical protein
VFFPSEPAQNNKHPFKMAMSGVELDPQCKLVYDEVQSKKKHRYVTFKIDDGKIRVDKVNKFIKLVYQ